MNANFPVQTPKKILVADDNPDVIETIFQYFSDAHQPYELLNACNGAIAYQIAQEELPDLIIMDWEMPIMSGLEVIGHLKKLEETRHIPIIIATGVQTGDRNLEEALEGGAVDYIRKPFGRLELLARSKSAMRMAALHQKEKMLMQSVIDAQNRELSTIALQVAQKNELLEGIVKKLQPIAVKNTVVRTYLKDIQSGLNLDNQWEKFKLHFEKVHPQFFVRLQQKYPALTPNELKMCAYMKMNLSIKETMQILNISKKGLETARYRIKKKLALTPKEDLHKLIHQF
ncbi:hypothetical protein BKI52_33260 [marine bacterium AO1-C]|nr:hypothetical protein BKI52_33260 [marine bacterium AO1-C]